MASRASTDEHHNGTLFVKDGAPVKFCFHRSVTQGRGQIARDVEQHGGRMVRDERRANVLLVDEQEDLAFLRRQYYSSTYLYRLSLYVESRGFVQHCIRSGTYCHIGPIKQGMPGRAPGGGRARRIPFTAEDRDHLAYYLATRCPTRDGRMGNGVYKDLVQLGQTDDLSWAWAKRHTLHSWREHYKIHHVVMDQLINHYLEQLKDVGHHFGHDLRRHDYRNLRQEEEEGEDEDEAEAEQQQQQHGQERRRRERREQEQDRPAAAAAGQVHCNLARRERDLVIFDEEGGRIHEEEEEEDIIIIPDPRRAKRHRVLPDAHRQRDVQETQVKRACVLEVSSGETRASGVEARRDEYSSMGEKDSDNEVSQEIEGSDLFGDRVYGDESRLKFDDAQDIDFPIPPSPRAILIPEPDDEPLSTQATLVASPFTSERVKEPTSVPGPTPLRVVEAQVPAARPTDRPTLQQTVATNRERVVVQRARVRGASAQPGPSVQKETRTGRDATAVEAWSRSVDRQPQPQHQPGLPRRRQDRRGRVKGKTKEEALVSTEEEPGPRETYAQEDVSAGMATDGPSAQEDEMVVEGLLGASIESGAEETGFLGMHEENDGDSDEDVMSELPQFQEIEIGGDPSDSDDVETHEALVQGTVRERSANKGGGQDQSEDQNGNSDVRGDGAEDQDQDQSEEAADADRIERMARRSLYIAPVQTLLKPGVTRSMATTQTRPRTRTQSQISPPRTRSGRTRVPQTSFPSPGTKAREVVDRFKEEERRVPYEPPVGTRAAKAVRGREQQG